MADSILPYDLAALQRVALGHGEPRALGVLPARAIAEQGWARIDADHGGSMVMVTLTEEGWAALWAEVHP